MSVVVSVCSTAKEGKVVWGGLFFSKSFFLPALLFRLALCLGLLLLLHCGFSDERIEARHRDAYIADHDGNALGISERLH